jgi:hypothetical protein
LLKNFDFFDLEVVVSHSLQCSQRWQLLCWRILEAEIPMHMLHVQHKHSAVTMSWPPKSNVLSPVGNPNFIHQPWHHRVRCRSMWCIDMQLQAILKWNDCKKHLTRPSIGASP